MSKRNISFICFLMLLSLVCVGFSAWNINIDDSAIGTIEVDNILDAVETMCEVFEYYDDTFLNRKNENGDTVFEFSNTGYIIITANLKVDEIKKYTNLALSLTLEQKRQDVDSIVNITYITNIYLDSPNGTPQQIVYSDYSVSTKIPLSDQINATYVFYIEFNVTNDNKTAFFNALLSGVSFNYLVTIEGE